MNPIAQELNQTMNQKISDIKEIVLSTSYVDVGGKILDYLKGDHHEGI